MKPFRPGDRVMVISIKETGTVDDITWEGNVGAAIVLLDDGTKLSKAFAVKEKIATAKSASKAMKYYTFTNDLQHIGSSKPEPDWKDIWDAN